MLGNTDEGRLVIGSGVDGTCAVDAGGEPAGHGSRENTVNSGGVETFEEFELTERRSL